MHSDFGKLEKRLPYKAWDKTTRCFHWINALCVLILTVFGLAILNGKTFGISSDGKILLKTLHTYTGYFFVVNLTWRFIWGFFGGKYSRWESLLPIGNGFIKELRLYVRGFIAGKAPSYLGHNPLSQLMISILMLLLLTQALTGLVLAGTDLYKPPFGSAIAEWVTGGDPDKLAMLKPGSKDHVDLAKYNNMRTYRKPIVTTHLYVFYVLMVAIALHIIGVIITEIREKNGLTSAMLTGEKVLPKPPVDG